MGFHFRSDAKVLIDLMRKVEFKQSLERSESLVDEDRGQFLIEGTAQCKDSNSGASLCAGGTGALVASIGVRRGG